MFDLFLRLIVALVLGAIVGTERNISHKAAGMRTYALVAMSAALFVVVNQLMIHSFLASGVNLTDALQIPSMIISGIGFMGAGIIVFKNSIGVTGLTTASGLWAAAGIGMAAGSGYFALAAMATLLALFIFEVLWHIEKRVKKIAEERGEES
jgi:putative Mg2+ transporter-C (MgtC) family protein